MKKYSTFAKTPGQEPHHSMSCPEYSLVVVLRLQRSAISVFFSISRLAKWICVIPWTHVWRRVLTPLQRCNQCILQRQQTGQMDLCHTLDTCLEEGSYPSAEVQSVYSSASADWPNGFVSYPGHMFGGGFLPLCRGAISVFYNLSFQGSKCF